MQAFSIKVKLLLHLYTNYNSKASVLSQLLSHSNFMHDASWHEKIQLPKKHFDIVL
jgi:hypothetical protein